MGWRGDVAVEAMPEEQGEPGKGGSGKDAGPAEAFARQRDGFAVGEGVPAGVAHSAGASRQWISDELTRSADELAANARAAGEAWLRGLWPRTAIVIGAGYVLLVLVAGLTAIGAGWTAARTAAVVAGAVTGGLLAGAAWLHRERGGVIAPLVGEDGRLSTSRAVAGGWVVFAAFAVLQAGFARAFGVSDAGGGALGGLVLVLAVTCGVAVLARGVVAVRLREHHLQKVAADRPRAADLLTDDSGRGSFADTQYALVSFAVLVYAAVALGRTPAEPPHVPWGLAGLVCVGAIAYLVGKAMEGGRPKVLSVVRAREAGDLHAPVRNGDDIEVRGTAFVPPGSDAPEQLARTVVRIGGVDVHVPLIPVAGGFANPSDTRLTVPVPAEVEPGRVKVMVITAAGARSNAVELDIVD